MDMPGLSNFEDTGPVATFSYLDTSSMLLSGPFCCDCMNLKKWKIVQLNTSGNLILYLHKIGENVRCEMWKLQLRNDSARPFTFVTTVDGLSPFPCSELNCGSNKPKNSAQKALAINDDALKHFESVERQRMNAILEKLQIVGEKSDQKGPLIDKEIQKHSLEKTSVLELLMGAKKGFSEIIVVPKTSKTQSLESVATYLNLDVDPVAPPFFYPSVGVKKPLDITNDLHKKFAEISNSKEFPTFIELLGEKFPDFCSELKKKGRPLTRCFDCEKSFNQWYILVLHMMSRKHIEQMTNSGHYFAVKDYELISNIYKEACARNSKEKLASGDVTGPGSEAKSSSVVSDVKSAESLEVSSTVAVKPKPKSAQLELPFLSGTPVESLRFPEVRLASALRFHRKNLAMLSPSAIQSFLQEECKRPKGSNCLKCNVKVTPSEWLDHVLSQEHIDNLTKSGRFVSPWDVARTHSILKQIQQAEKKAALRKDDSEEPDVESEQNASPTIARKPSWKSRGTRGTRPRARAVRG